jgi:histidine ammonia-lyase
MAGNTMPESWVRAAMLIRMNSLIRGHSGVRWKCIESLGNMLKADIVPLVPLRGSISASGGRFWVSLLQILSSYSNSNQPFYQIFLPYLMLPEL